MSNERDPKGGAGGGRGASPEEQKPTVPPPPALYDPDDPEDATAVTNVPEELIAESLRSRDKKDDGGLRQMFSRDPAQIRSALPTEQEGDALLDMLFDDARERTIADDDEQTTVAASPAGAPRNPAPLAGRPLPPPPPGARPDHGASVGTPRPPTAPPAAPPRPPPPPLAPRPGDGPHSAPQIPRPAPSRPMDPTGGRPATGARPAPPPPRGAAPPAPPSARPPVQSPRAPLPPIPPRAELATLDPDALEAVSAEVARTSAASVSIDLEETGEERPMQVSASDLVELVDTTDRVELAAPLPARRTSAPSGDEHDASAQLVERGLHDAWMARAAWLRAEAEANEDRAARARGLLVSSELYAMAGEETTARLVANEARELAPSAPIVQRQTRGLMAQAGDWRGVLDAVEHEVKVAPSPAARCHGALLHAAIARHRLGDAETAGRGLDFAIRVMPSDPRAYVERIGEALASSPDDGAAAALGRIRLPDAPDLAPIAQVLGELAALRSPLPHKSTKAAASAHESLIRGRSALADGDLVAAVDELAALAGAPGLRGGAGWLTAVLAAPRKETRPVAVLALREVVGGSHGAFARRALAARAIELGDAAAAASATEAADPTSFSSADRIALDALTASTREASRGSEEVQRWIEAAAYDEDLAPLTAAASAALTDPADPERRWLHVGTPRARAAAALGRTLAAGARAADGDGRSPLQANEQLVSAVVTFSDLDSENGAAKALSLELDVDAGAGSRVAHTISGWNGRASDVIEGPEGRDRALAGALLSEAAGEIERALGDLDRARLSDPTHEGAARARSSHAEPVTAAKIMAEHGAQLDAGTRAAIILSEAAIRLVDAGHASDSTAGSEDCETMLRRASEMDPKLPYAVHMGERTARARGDRDALIDWLRKRREASDDPLEQAHDLVREALLLSDGEGSPAAILLEQALRARPKDVGLRELYERLAPEPPADYAAWRAARAGDLSGTEAARLSLEAALEYERAGDLANAAAAAQQAIRAGDDLLAPICAYRAAIHGHGASDLVDTLLPRARESTDPIEKLETYERLADLDELGRNDIASGLLWRRTILEETGPHLPTLRRVASTLIAGGRDDELEPIALEIAEALEGPESAAHAMLSARLRLKALGWDETLKPVELAYKSQPRGVWALRQMAAHARVKGQSALAVEVDRQLIERTERPAEAATLSVRAAEDAAKAGEVTAARELLARAIESVPEHVVAHMTLARVLEEAGEAAGAAAAYEAAAAATNVPAARVDLLYQAQRLWLDEVKEVERAQRVLEDIAAIDTAYLDVFARLQSIYVASGARAELAGLLRRRLDAVTDPGERVEMEVLRGKALAEVGETAAAKHALAAALEGSPDHVDALSAFADLCAAEEDWQGAEQAWIRLARLVSEPSRQSVIYLKLGDLYDERLPNPERAELAYREILKRADRDPEGAASGESARERLVHLYRKSNDAARAIEEQTVLITGAQAPEAKCKRTCELAEIYEGAGDLKKAEATLLNARKTWPKDEVALAALVRFYQRTSQAPAAQVLLDRAVADARRALSTGRFEPFLFSTIATVAELRGRPDAARISLATVRALDGEPTDIDGAGNHAGDPRLDDLLAPDVMTPAFRELLLKTGPLLDAAVPLDLAAIRATPLPPPGGEIGEQVRLLATAYGLPGVHVHVSAALGSVCVAAGTNPPTIVLGQPLVATPRQDVRTFLMHRALKVLQSNTGAFSRTAPIDLWPLLAAYLKAFAPTWTPVGVDAGKLADAYGRVSRALSGLRIDPQVGLLAADVIGTIGNRASTLNTVVNGWGDRAGLLALGDPNIAVTAVAWAGGHTNAPPASGKERLTWIGRNAEARELIVFSVSDGYADARARLGLGR